MKSRVTYEKEMRDRAANSQRGLYTIDLINASKRPCCLGSRMTFQGPIDGREYKAICDFALKLIKARQR